MRHIEEKVVLAEPNLLTVVVELRHTIGTNHNESLIVETKLAFRQCSKILHHNQLVAIAYPQGIRTAPWFEILYLHDVRFLLFGCKVRKKYPIFAVQYIPKSALLLIIRKKEAL